MMLVYIYLYKLNKDHMIPLDIYTLTLKASLVSGWFFLPLTAPRWIFKYLKLTFLMSFL